MTDIVQQPVRIAEELILLMLDETTGYLEMVPGWDFSCVMAGAVIADLALANRIDTDLESLFVVDPTPMEDVLLDPVLEQIIAASAKHDARYWIEKTAGRSDDIVATTLARLVKRGILSHDIGGFWSLSRTVSRLGTYPINSTEVRMRAKDRILDVVLNENIPNPVDAILIALMHSCGGFKRLLDEEDYTEKLNWIRTVTKLELVGRMVADAVKDTSLRPRTKSVFRSKPIPKLNLIDITRHRAFFNGNISKGLYGVYEKHGPVVRLPFKMRGYPMYLAMGEENNQWINKNGRFYLRTKEYIGGFEAVFGASRTMPGSDGAEHYRLRKSLREPYSRSALVERLPELIHYCRKSMSKWKEGDVLPMTHAIRNHMSEQISRVLLGVNCSHFSEDVLDYSHRALTTHVQRALPKFMLHTPKMRRCRKRVLELLEMVISSHTSGQRKKLPRDLADAFIELHNKDPQFVSETDLGFPLAATMVASIYTSAGLSFALYFMIKNPDVYDQLYQEAEALYGGEREPKREEFSKENLDTTIRFYMEVTRLRAVIPWQLRAVVNRCVISGYEIPAESMLLVGHTSTHYDGKLYKDPLKFDIDRYLPERSEHTQPGAYMPYGLGTHTCLGRRWTELQIAVNISLLAYHLKLEIRPKNYKLRTDPFPTSAPAKKLKMYIAEVRNPIDVSKCSHPGEPGECCPVH